jgi:predicted MFS family arabinose efflux permease
MPSADSARLSAPATAASQATFGEVFAVGEFRALWLAQILSVAGDQLARVALTLLVFDRTGSPLLAAVTYAAGLIPLALGGVTLSGLADRLPRREVMIWCDVSRAALVASMALPGVPDVALIGLLFLLTLISAPFASARAALYRDILVGDRYVAGIAITLTAVQFAQVLGFAVSGAIVAFFGVRTSLLVDAVTFIISGAIIRIWVRARPPARDGPHPDLVVRPGRFTAVRLAFTDPALRTPMLFAWLVAFYYVPEGVSAPLAGSLGGGAIAVGLILASQALGASVGAIAFSRFVSPARRLRWMGPLAITACGVLIAFVFRPPLPVALAILTVSGIFDCYQLAANASFVTAAPARHRSGAFGVAQAGMSLGQGAAMILAGAAAQTHSPSSVIAAGGAIGALCGTAVAVSQVRSRSSSAEGA